MQARAAFGGRPASDMGTGLAQTAAFHSPLSEGWEAADAFHQALAGHSAVVTAQDSRPWHEVYADAMDEHFREKGLIL